MLTCIFLNTIIHYRLSTLYAKHAEDMWGLTTLQNDVVEWATSSNDQHSHGILNVPLAAGYLVEEAEIDDDIEVREQGVKVLPKSCANPYRDFHSVFDSINNVNKVENPFYKIDASASDQICILNWLYVGYPIDVAISLEIDLVSDAQKEERRKEGEDDVYNTILQRVLIIDRRTLNFNHPPMIYKRIRDTFYHIFTNDTSLLRLVHFCCFL